MASKHEPQRVSAADFIRGFANWRLRAAQRPVVVTHHGKDAHVLVSLDDYRRLDQQASRKVAAAADMLRDSQAALLESIRDAVLLIDRDFIILSANPAASDLLETAAAALIGQSVFDAVPGSRGGAFAGFVQRLIGQRERFSGDVPAILRPDRWTHVDLIPLQVGGAIILRDASEAIAATADVAVRGALEDAIGAHGAMGYARLSVREAVEEANGALTSLVGVDASAIRRVRFSALLPLAQRAAFTDALETVFRGGVAVRHRTELVTREGRAVAVTLCIAELRGPYASDGAILLVVPD